MNKLSEGLEAMLRESVDMGQIFGGSVLVVRDGRELAYAQSGMADPALGTPVDRNTIFRLYSQSKPITAAAAMLLVERGQLDVMSPVSRYLPSFEGIRVLTPAGSTVPAEREVRVQDLLSMTSGLVYPGDDAAGRYADELFRENAALMAAGGGMDTVTFCDRMGRLPLAFQPGALFRYGTSADVLGAVIEVCAGMRFGDFLKQELFEPLGMADTGFFVPPEKRDRLAATCWRKKDHTVDTWVRPHLCCAITTERPAFESGGAGLYATIGDYERFARMLLQKGEWQGKRILSPRTVAWMTEAQLTMDQAGLKNVWPQLSGYGYGKLMRVCQEPGMAGGLCSRGEYGWDGWLGTYFANLPQEKTTILYMTSRLNEDRESGLVQRLRNRIISSL